MEGEFECFAFRLISRCAGHGRLAAAKLVGLREILCIRVNQLDEARKAFALAELSGWDNDILKLEFTSTCPFRKSYPDVLIV